MLKNILSFLGFVLLLLAIAFTIELFRRRGIRNFAQAHGGTFTPGESTVPEAANFPGDSYGAPSHSNVVRIRKGDATYVFARAVTVWRDSKDQLKSQGHCVCFITAPDLDVPDLVISSPAPTFLRSIGSSFSNDQTPAAVPLPNAVPGFADRFEIRPMTTASASTTLATAPAHAMPLSPDRLARLFPPALQKDLIASADASLFSSLEVRNNTIRISAVEKYGSHPYPALLDLARRMLPDIRR